MLRDASKHCIICAIAAGALPLAASLAGLCSLALSCLSILPRKTDTFLHASVGLICTQLCSHIPQGGIDDHSKASWQHAKICKLSHA